MEAPFNKAIEKYIDTTSEIKKVLSVHSSGKEEVKVPDKPENLFEDVKSKT